jgi:ParB family chromosome partitioning protein
MGKAVKKQDETTSLAVVPQAPKSQPQVVKAQRRTNALMDPKELVIVTDPDEPFYDERWKLPLNEGLVLNMMEFGVIESISVAKRGQQFIVADGRQRVKNLIEANRRLVEQGKEPFLIECSVKHGDDDTLEGLSISTFIRTDDSILGKAKKAVRRITSGKSFERVGLEFGVSHQAVRNWVTLLSMHKDIQSAVENNELTLAKALEWAKLTKEEQAVALKDYESGGGRKGGDKRKNKGEKKDPPKDKPAKDPMRPVDEVAAFYAVAKDRKVRAALAWILCEEEECPEV